MSSGFYSGIVGLIFGFLISFFLIGKTDCEEGEECKRSPAMIIGITLGCGCLGWTSAQGDPLFFSNVAELLSNIFGSMS